MSRDRFLPIALSVAVAAGLAPRPARACGPDFPVSLLLDRGDTLGTLPEGLFLDDVTHLVEPTDSYPYVADAGPAPDDAGTRERALYEAGDYEGVLALPAAARQRRSVRAAYMLGRARDGRAGIRAYQLVRTLVDRGFDDGAGLALSSLGQEARLHLRVGDPVGALHLYAEQAALGHPDGATSLLFVTRDLIAGGHERDVLGDAVGQRLLATYLATRSLELTDEQADRVWQELAAIDGIAGADELAAAAYHRGVWDRARQLVAHAGDTPLADWVRAKLALRDGDKVAADRLLARAADGFRQRDACPATATPADATADATATADDVDPTDDPTPTCGGPEHDRIVGERATVAVSEGRMTDALALAWEVRRQHPDDLTYIAERLVTIDELRTFVDALPDTYATPTFAALEWNAGPDMLRALLGRRLMRAGRYTDAIPYLDASARAPAVEYALAMTTADHARDRVDRARALFTASLVARRDGLEILGTANAPDWGFYGAEYDRMAWEDPPWVTGKSFVELARLAASAPVHGERYHYRHVAADLAEQAADLLPHQSQAYVASLCWAAHQIQSVDPARVEALYARATRGEPSIDDLDFPGRCPLPDFDHARALLHAPAPSHHAAAHGRSHPHLRALAHRIFGHGARGRRRAELAAAGVAGLVLLGLGLAWGRRRWRRFAPRP